MNNYINKYICRLEMMVWYGLIVEWQIWSNLRTKRILWISFLLLFSYLFPWNLEFGSFFLLFSVSICFNFVVRKFGAQKIQLQKQYINTETHTFTHTYVHVFAHTFMFMHANFIGWLSIVFYRFFMSFRKTTTTINM